MKKLAKKSIKKKKVLKRKRNPSISSNSSQVINTGRDLSTVTLNEIESMIFNLTDFLESEQRDIEKLNNNDIRSAKFNKLIESLNNLNEDISTMNHNLSLVLAHYKIDY